MRKRKPEKKPVQRDRVFIDRSPARDKFTLDLDTSIASASERGLSSADVIELLLLRAEQTALMAKERGDDLSRLNELLFGEEEAA